MSQALLSFVLAACLLSAQSNIASGDLQGTITDPSGGVIAQTQVRVTHEPTGLSRSIASGADGAYRFLLLPPGDYVVTVERENFRTHIGRQVRITVGQTANYDVRLELGVSRQAIEVSAGVALIESERAHQADTLEQETLQRLPINRRDYLSFTLLAPGVVDSTGLVDDTDFRVPQTPTSGLSFSGSNGRGNFIAVDGSEANTALGSFRPTVSQEAVQEFQINRSNYSAEFGGASGGVINIITRSGTNRLHGSLFGYFRHEDLDAGDPFAADLRGDRLLRVKPPSKRQQFGGSLGGPVSRDRSFYFGAFEGRRRRESSVVSVLTDPAIFQPTHSQQAIISRLPPDQADPLRRALTSPPETVELFRRNSGVFPFATDDWKFSTRLDHRLRPGDDLLLRYTYAKGEETNATVQALVGASRGNRVEGFDSTSALGWTHTFSHRTLNESRFQWNYRDFRVSSLEKFGPQIDIAGFGFFNRDLLLPSSFRERRYEIRNNFSHHRGAHLIKLGGVTLVRNAHNEVFLFHGGSFTFGELPGSLVSTALASTTINALQAFNLGLAQSFRQGVGDPILNYTSPDFGLFLQDAWQVRQNLTLHAGVRYEFNGRLEPMPTDTNNFAPRFGFAWNLFGDRKTIVRGGYGIYYSPVYHQIDFVARTLDNLNDRRQFAQVATTILTPGASSSVNIFQTLRRQGIVGVPTPVRSIAPADVAQFGLAFQHTGPLPPLTVLFGHSPDYVNPYSQQASLNLERQLGADLALSIGGTLVRTLKLTRARDINLLPAPVDPRLGIRVWSARDFVDPLVAQNNVYESTARAYYGGLIVELRKRFSRSFSLNANYTFSRATDDVVDFNSDFQANDQTNLRAENSLSSFDQRHKFVAYGAWDAPAGFLLAPIVRANSGRPFNLLAGFDLNGDRHSSTDRPGFAGRNTGLGPNFWTVDLRLGRNFPLGEWSSLEFTAEAFNLFNRLNFGSINNTGIGNIPPPFNLRGRRDRRPSEPLGFTSALDARRIQLGVRVRFR